MPTYLYEREDGSLFEKYQSFEEEKLDKCPRTGQPVKRLITGGADTSAQSVKGSRTSVAQKRNKLGDLGTSLSDYYSIQQRQRKAFEEKQAEKRKNKN